MGEIAEAILDGELCEGCGEWMGGACGYPRRCDACEAFAAGSIAPKRGKHWRKSQRRKAKREAAGLPRNKPRNRKAKEARS